jgi:hypothetical protein
MGEIEVSDWPSPKSSCITASIIPKPTPVNVTSSGAVPDVGDAAKLLFDIVGAVILIVTIQKAVTAVVHFNTENL